MVGFLGRRGEVCNSASLHLILMFGLSELSRCTDFLSASCQEFINSKMCPLVSVDMNFAAFPLTPLDGAQTHICVSCKVFPERKRRI